MKRTFKGTATSRRVLRNAVGTNWPNNVILRFYITYLTVSGNVDARFLFIDESNVSVDPNALA